MPKIQKIVGLIKFLISESPTPASCLMYPVVLNLQKTLFVVIFTFSLCLNLLYWYVMVNMSTEYILTNRQYCVVAQNLSQSLYN